MNRLTARLLAVFNRLFVDYLPSGQDVLGDPLGMVRRCANHRIVDLAFEQRVVTKVVARKCSFDYQTYHARKH